MRNRDGFTIIELALIVVIISIITAVAVPNYIAMQSRAKEASVLATAHTVQLTAEDFSVHNDGVYSDQAADLTPLFPGADLLLNAFTGVNSEPQFGAQGVTPGQVGIQVVMVAGVNVGYSINGIGKAGEITSYSTGQ